MTKLILLEEHHVALGDNPVATGGEAAVYELADRPDLLVKLYHETPDTAQVRRLTSMIGMRPLAGHRVDRRQAAELAWPVALARTPAGAVVGYSMGRFLPPEYVQLNALFSLRNRQTRFRRNVDWRFLLGVAWNLAYMTTRLHSEGILVGDFSARNIVVSQDGFVIFLDCDSMAFTDPVTNEGYSSSMHTMEYTAPERYDGAEVSEATDNFALAVLVFQLLTGGNHPYGGQPRDSTSSTDISMRSRIFSGTTYVTHPHRIIIPKNTVLLDTLPPAVLDLARRTFGPDAAEPGKRPTSAEWFQVLQAARSSVRTCATQDNHAYSTHLTECPWCSRTARSEPDLFESSAVPTAATSPGAFAVRLPATNAPVLVPPLPAMSPLEGEPQGPKLPRRFFPRGLKVALVALVGLAALAGLLVLTVN